MDNGIDNNLYTTATTVVWEASCKDCQAERRTASVRNKSRLTGNRQTGRTVRFEYSGSWATRVLERGNSRSDRCERHRRTHRQAIKALAVPYVDLRVIGQVSDPNNPTGPLGGLGSLPVRHTRRERRVDLRDFEFGMSDADILNILKGLTERRVAVVEAGTGTGKSTLMPFRLMNPPPNAPLSLIGMGPIVVTEPRRAAATGVARFVGESLCFGHDSQHCAEHFGAGFPVGYQVSGDKNWDDSCDLLYVTDGTMINWIRDGHLARIGTVIIDEAHERSENIDIILAQLRDKLEQHDHLRVVITSATLDREFFTTYFGGKERVSQYSVPEVKSFGYGVPLFIDTPVDDALIADGMELPTGGPEGGPLKLAGWSKYAPADDHESETDDLHAETRQLEQLRCVAKSETEEWPKKMPSAVADQIVAIASGTVRGDILGFLPTSAAIDECVQKVESELQHRGLDFDVYPLLSSVPRDVAAKATAARTRGEKRRIVVSSNLAETSLTVKGVRYVVDSGLVCQPAWDPEIASESFPTKCHSQSGLRQRWGRVGRDAPGWVFPLYTTEQFMSLPRNTPPGSTQTNLESFCMKLVTAGMDLDEVELPASFTHDSEAVDSEDRKSKETFEREISRARRVLRDSGMMDHDGHPTEFGRELARFPGEGSHGLAIMLADQLACVHEVALALEVLAQGALIGHRPDCVLQIDRGWPQAWRVTAAERHRAFATGCADDLELLIRVFEHWHRAKDPEQWCRFWWVNSASMERIWSAVADTIKYLSAAVKQEALRSVSTALTERARAVLCRAFPDSKYVRVEADSFRNRNESADGDATLSRIRLTEGSATILAFNRFRAPGTGTNRDASQMPIISHYVDCREWADVTLPADHDVGLDLLMAVAERKSMNRRRVEVEDALAEALAAYPAGALFDVSLKEGENTVHRVEAIAQPFAFPGDFESPRVQGGSNPAGFDRDFDPSARTDSVLPEEEAEERILDPRKLETNDALSGVPPSHDDTSQPTKTRISGISITRPDKTAVFQSPHRLEVVGYRVLEDGGVKVVARQAAPDANTFDPAQHPDLESGDEVKVSYDGTFHVHDSELFCFKRADGQGVFYLSTRDHPGIFRFDTGFLKRLTIGSVFDAQVFPRGRDPLSCSLLPAARAFLERAKTVTLPTRNEREAFFPASFASQPDDYGRAAIVLDHTQAHTGLSYEFHLHKRDLSRAKFVSAEPGNRVLVALRNVPPSRQRGIPVPRDVDQDELIRLHRGIVMEGGKIKADKGGLTSQNIHTLADASKVEGWERLVWELYEDSLRLEPHDPRAELTTKSVTVPQALVSILTDQKSAVSRACGAKLQKCQDGTIAVSSEDPAVVDSTLEEMNSLAQKPRVRIRISPTSAVSYVIGSNGRTIKRLRAVSGIVALHVEAGTVTIIGDSPQVVNTVVSQIHEIVTQVTARVTVPIDKVGIFIGTKGVNINAFMDASGVSPPQQVGPNEWELRGKDKESIRRFKSEAQRKVSGIRVRETDVQEISVVEDTTRRTEPSRTVKKDNGSSSLRTRFRAQEKKSQSAREASSWYVPLQSEADGKSGPPRNKQGANSKSLFRVVLWVVSATAIALLFFV